MTRGPVRSVLVDPAAPRDRPHLLRPLPLALADLRVALPRPDRARGPPRSSRCASRVTFAVAIAVVRPRRAADPRAAAVVDPGPRAVDPDHLGRHRRRARCCSPRRGPPPRPRPDLSAVEQFTRILNAPPPPGSTRVLLAGDSIAVTLGFDAVRPSQRKDIWLKGVARVGCGLLTGTPVSRRHAGPVAGGVPRLAAAVRQGRAARTSPTCRCCSSAGGRSSTARSTAGRSGSGRRAMEAELRTALDRARSASSPPTARELVILTTPCFSPTTRELGEFGEAARADPARVQWLNDVWRRYAADHPDVTAARPRRARVPGREYAPTIDGVTDAHRRRALHAPRRPSALEVARTRGAATSPGRTPAP